MTRRPLALAALALASTALLAGCALIPSGPVMIDADDIADTAEEALEDAYDIEYKVDCGDDEVELDEGENIDCIATERESDLEWDAEVEITEVKGTKYEIEVELADEPNNADEVEDDTDTDTDTDGAVTVPGEDIASLAVEALSPVLGYEPSDMACASDEVEIYVDNIEYCGFTGEDGEIVYVDVTITSYDEESGDYEIWAEVVE